MGLSENCVSQSCSQSFICPTKMAFLGVCTCVLHVYIYIYKYVYIWTDTKQITSLFCCHQWLGMFTQSHHETLGMQLFVMTKALKKEPPADVPRSLGK